MPQRFGILGAGQLAQMMISPARQLGLTPQLYAQSLSDPAALICSDTTVGSLSDAGALRKFLDNLPVATFESEFVDSGILAAATKDISCRLAPDRNAIRILQNKLAQKRLCQRLRIPTSDFEVYTSTSSALDWQNRLATKWPHGFVLKWSHLGYDGKGVLLVPDPVACDQQKLKGFLAKAQQQAASVYAEPFVRYKQELAMVGARGLDGQKLFFPLVVTEQQQGICKYVLGAASQHGVAAEIEEDAQQILGKIADDLNYCGVLAVEFFEDQHGKLLVNEIAPRVHNTGHYTQNAAKICQFEAHVRAINGLPLEPVTLQKNYFGMINILGPNDASLQKAQLPAETPLGIFVHWYQKSQLRPGRKLGHINVAASSKKEFDQLWRQAKSADANWQKTAILEFAKGER